MVYGIGKYGTQILHNHIKITSELQNNCHSELPEF